MEEFNKYAEISNRSLAVLKDNLENDLINSEEKLKPLCEEFLEHLEYITKICRETNKISKKINKFEERYKSQEIYTILLKSHERFQNGLNLMKQLVPLRLEIYKRIKKLKNGGNIEIYIEKFKFKPGFSEDKNSSEYWLEESFFQTLPPTAIQKFKKEVCSIVF